MSPAGRSVRFESTMLNVQKCPDSFELKLMLLGRLPAARTAAIEDHLDGCNLCLATVGELEVQSQIVDLLKSQPPSLDVPPDLDHLLTTLDALHPGIESEVDDTAEGDLPSLIRSDNPSELGRLAHFRILAQLGSGGMGIVYLANDTRLQRSVALKVLRPRTARDPEARDRFLREARAVASIKHDHVVVVHDVGEAPSAGGETTIPYLAMELLDGISLQAWMKEHPRAAALDVVRFGKQIAEALAALHARGLVHRDVKPGNLWLEQNRLPNLTPGDRVELGKLKLLDFGLASNDVASETRALGTPAYMAPEQFRGEAVDARTDLFALGSVLYELCTGEHPFPDRRVAAEYDDPLPARDINAALPAALSDLIARLLQDNPADRPESARQVLRELSEIERSLIEAGVAAKAPPRRHAAWTFAALGVLAVAAIVFALNREPPRVPIPPLAANPPAAKAPSPAPPPVDPAFDKWCAEVRTYSAAKQFNAVAERLEQLNPGYNKKHVTGWVEPEAAIRFTEYTDKLDDIRPLGCLIDLKTIKLAGARPDSGKLTSLAPLQSLRLHSLNVSKNPKLTDLSPLKKMLLFNLDASDTGVASLDDLAGLPLVELRVARTPVNDLGPVRTLSKLKLLDIDGCPIASLEPLKGSSTLEEIHLDFNPERDTAVLKSLPKLRQINGIAAATFWDSQP